MNPTTPTQPTPTTTTTTTTPTYTPVQNVTNAAQIPAIVDKLNQQDEELGRQKTVMGWILTLTIGVSIVCFIAFTTFIIDAWWHHTEADTKNTEMLNSLSEENRKLKEKPMNDKIDALQAEIVSLQQKIASFSAK